MTRPTDLPAALPIAIAMALLVLILAPLLDTGPDEQQACAQRGVTAASVGAPAPEGSCDD